VPPLFSAAIDTFSHIIAAAYCRHYFHYIYFRLCSHAAAISAIIDTPIIRLFSPLYARYIIADSHFAISQSPRHATPITPITPYFDIDTH